MLAKVGSLVLLDEKTPPQAAALKQRFAKSMEVPVGTSNLFPPHLLGEQKSEMSDGFTQGACQLHLHGRSGAPKRCAENIPGSPKQKSQGLFEMGVQNT